MKKILLISFLFISIYVSATTYYVATTGDDEAAGSLAAPWLTWNKAISTANVGDTVYFRDGVYTGQPYAYCNVNSSDGHSGTHDDPICYFNYPGEVPILDGMVMAFVNTDNIHIKGLTIRNFPQTDPSIRPAGLTLTFGSNNVIVENCTVHDIGARGFYTVGVDSVYFFNCDSYNNSDPLSSAPGNAGDGFIVTAPSTNDDVTSYVVLRGCRSWHNSDDGYDMSTEGYIQLDSCYSINNGYLSGGNGCGFKLSLTRVNYLNHVTRRVTNCIAAYNAANGFDTNDRLNECEYITAYNNTSYYNGYKGKASYGFYIRNSDGTDAQELTRIFRNNIAYANQDGNVYVVSGGLYTHDHNSWDSGTSVDNSDFVSVDSTGMTGARQADGSLPELYFLRLSSTSDLINAGTDVGLDYLGDNPDIGAYEFGDFDEEPSPPYISTYAVSSITTVSAKSGGYMISDGGGTISAKGICWDTSANPDLTDNVINGGTGTDDFVITISGLSLKTVYHVRAFATNESGTRYGADEEFTTSQSSIIKHGGKIVKR